MAGAEPPAPSNIIAPEDSGENNGADLGVSETPQPAEEGRDET
jgi:hypothetical protein